ncbi:hypothetical protein EVAR_28436_1 [Eumeta japonica]|uniref:Uncharacterized protein n=1 Tax=Eumeta variegata TaxID=151549 RepID=A0A4C1V7X7_EUMVA|nr:hypothetical protein EVAR_28436_1 [Eumeta japonica]
MLHWRTKCHVRRSMWRVWYKKWDAATGDIHCDLCPNDGRVCCGQSALSRQGRRAAYGQVGAVHVIRASGMRRERLRSLR